LNRGRWWRCLLLLLPSVALAGRGGVSLHMEGPRRAPADGRTPVRLVAQLTPAGRGELVEVEPFTSGGTVGKARPVPGRPSAIEFDFVPPHLIASARVTVGVRARFHGKLLQTVHNVQLDPAVLPPAERATGGPFDLRVPRRILLGAPGRAEISIAPPGNGVAPRAWISSGTLSPWRADGKGRLRATFTAPAQDFPQLTLVAVTAGGALDWTAIPLLGRAAIDLESEPRAQVRVQLGDLEFGPVHTDGRGRARILVAAPPGVPHATTVATDGVGNVKRSSIDLRPPAFSRLLVLCPEGRPSVRVLAVSPAGEPLRQDRLTMRASIGQLSRPRPVAPGVFEADYTAPKRARVGDALVVTASLAGATGPGAECRGAIAAESPAALRIRLDRPAYVAGSGRALEVALQGVYSGRLPALEVPVRAEVDVGTVSEPVRGADGVLRVAWTLPDDFQGRQRARLTARTEVDSPVVAASEVALQPGAVRHLRVSSAQLALTADGTSTTEISVAVSDAHGNPVPGLPLVGSARGRVSAFVPAGPGRYRATYAPVRSLQPGHDQIQVRVPGSAVVGTTRIVWIPARRPRSAAVRLGYLSNLGKVEGPLLSIDASWRLPVWRDRIAVGLESGMYRSDTQFVGLDATGGEEMVTAEVVAIPLLARVVVGFAPGPLVFYAGGGAGAAIARVILSSASAYGHSSFQPYLAASVLAGTELAFGPGRVAVEAGHLWAHSSGAVHTGNLGGFHLTGGYRLDF
jgi:hypothetical protein